MLQPTQEPRNGLVCVPLRNDAGWCREQRARASLVSERAAVDILSPADGAVTKCLFSQFLKPKMLSLNSIIL